MVLLSLAPAMALLGPLAALAEATATLPLDARKDPEAVRVQHALVVASDVATATPAPRKHRGNVEAMAVAVELKRPDEPTAS
jgi:hypothetical protein